MSLTFAEFYNNSVKYYEYLKTVIGVRTDQSKSKSIEVVPPKRQGKPSPNVESELSLVALSKLESEVFDNIDLKRLKFLVFCLEELHSNNSQFKAILAIADFHLRAKEIERAAEYIEKVVFDETVDSDSKRAHNLIVKESRSLRL